MLSSLQLESTLQGFQSSSSQAHPQRTSFINWSRRPTKSNFGDPKVDLVQLLSTKKFQLDSIPAVLEKYLTSLRQVLNIELRRNDIILTSEEERLIKIFTRTHHGARCSIQQIGGGLSGSKVFKLVITNSGGIIVHEAICKIGPPEVIHDEGERYNNISRDCPRKPHRGN